MKFWLDRPWPVGQHLLPRAIVIDSASEDQWSVIARGRGVPADAIPLDDEARATMALYEFNGQRASLAKPD